MKIDCVKLPVMKAHCKTCPFKQDDKGRMRDAELASRVIARTLFQAHQLCHGTNDTTRCKGAFDHNQEIYDRMGVGHLIQK